MDFRVLGGLELRDRDRVLPLGAPMRRVLLAHLLLAVERPVPARELVERLWGPAAPERAGSTLQVHVLRLRRALAQAACAARIETGLGSYCLDTDVLDAVRFEKVVDQARRAEEIADVARESALLDEALDCWPVCSASPIPCRTSSCPRSSPVGRRGADLFPAQA